ncbi:uncharacterized protein LOC116251614 isoform X1 [Nymphaea colorata]|uniref:uncharacterized protein LOC116251614 isoform X1 n=1 Tax=Nymphaea colorata TaxID=210225 RepID=UPI00214EBA71|nr:uncharacterized protein LOC116251614 isoform X1 [Nymphaea colorata]
MADSQNVPGILPQVQQSRAPFLGGSQGVPGPMMQPQATPFVGASHASVAPPMQAAPAPFSGGQSCSPTMRPPAPPFLGATQSVPPLMQAPAAPFMGSSQPMPPPMQQPPPPFVGGSQVMHPPPPPTSLPYGSQPWPSQLAQTPQESPRNMVGFATYDSTVPLPVALLFVPFPKPCSGRHQLQRRGLRPSQPGEKGMTSFYSLCLSIHASLSQYLFQSV